ncbi:MAG: peroxidase family protein, partial [Caulobacterales bacterium]
RDLGLGTLNQTREDLGLKAYTSFNQITSDKDTAAALKQAFGTVDKVDLWTGGLSENHARGAMVGQTFQAIITQQFENLRDGDRLWFERQGFDAKTLNNIEHTTLSDIIERNTDADYVQDDAFVYYSRHSGTLGGVTSDDPGGPQLIMGSVGTDRLVGGAKGDILVPETGGWQTLTGGAGADKFVFTEKGIKAVITDFKPGLDAISFDHAHLPALAAGGHLPAGVHYVKGSTILEIGGDHIVVQHTTPQQLLGHHDYLLA